MNLHFKVDQTPRYFQLVSKIFDKIILSIHIIRKVLKVKFFVKNEQLINLLKSLTRKYRLTSQENNQIKFNV